MPPFDSIPVPNHIPDRQLTAIADSVDHISSNYLNRQSKSSEEPPKNAT
jgi:hypothetical protein